MWQQHGRVFCVPRRGGFVIAVNELAFQGDSVPQDDNLTAEYEHGQGEDHDPCHASQATAEQELHRRHRQDGEHRDVRSDQ
jgi:hypothetical protein